ncbi:MAG: hypothetical protein M1833_000450 [Piccolia ochrophora]|nr:MAG: hypothetical protein M1833_000450 [Piccolia ochrophora]
MPFKKFDLPPVPASRPLIHHRESSASHISSSVPSTPHQHARKLSFGSRSPSPHRGASQSPRSVYSESNSQLPSLRKAPAACKFEKGMAFSRRRMHYSIGADKLEKAKAKIKEGLRPEEEKKLSGDMRELYDRLLPSPESEERRARFVQKLEKLLNERWPENKIQVRVFGSSGNLLCTSDSDVDICITTTLKELEKTCTLASVLADHGMERVICVPWAKVPIVKFWDPELQLACDMNVNNTLALENTRMIKTYIEIDERVRPLAMIIKYWTKRRILNDAALGGTLSSYTWICLILNFLQTRNPPVLPCLHQRPHQKRAAAEGVETSFADDIEALKGFGRKNEQSLGELLFHFFRYYGHEVDYNKDVISVRRGKLISKEEKGWHLMQNNGLCVEEPFNVTRNLGNTADDTSVRGLHIELRRAFTLLADNVNLASCCEQYEFPAEEERIWERPAPQPRPVLTRSRSGSQTGKAKRGGGVARGGRQQFHQGHRGNANNRRASSAATYGNANMLQQPQLGLSAQDYYRQTQQIQEQLYQSYQRLQAQENELRFQLLQQQAAAQAQAHAQAIAQAHARGENAAQSFSQGTPANIHVNGRMHRRKGHVESPPLTAPLRQEMFYYPLQYAPQPSFVQQSASTNPSSPSLAKAVPELRRSLHRSQPSENATNGSLRSQSQPARGLSSPLALQTFPMATNLHPTVSSLYSTPQNQKSSSAILLHGQIYPNGDIAPKPLPTGSSLNHGGPKEYVGYYVGGSPGVQSLHEDIASRRQPTFGDMRPFKGDISPEQLPSPALKQMQLESRSPSPPESGGALVNGSNSAPMPSRPFPLNGLASTRRRRESRGPLVVNGSSTPSAQDTQAHKTSMSESTSASEDLLSDTPATTADDQFPDTMEPGEANSAQQQLYAKQLLELHTQAQVPKPNSNAPPAGRSLVTSSVPLSIASTRSLPTSPHVGPSGLPTATTKRNDALVSSPSERADLSLTSIPPLDIAHSHDTRQDNILGIRHLSPVIEAHPPSNRDRKQETSLTKGANGILTGSRDMKGREPQPPPTPASQGSKETQSEFLGQVNGHFKEKEHAGVPSNPWQQTGSKGKKGTKAVSKKGASGGRGVGEPVPVDESERKGG